MACISLTPNAILALNGGDVDLRPLLQVLDVKQIGTGQTAQDRYRLLLSDGAFVLQAMLATQLNDYIKSGQVQKGTIVQLMEYICNSIQQRKIIIVLNMEIIASSSEIIGDPKPIISTEQAAVPSGLGGIQPQQQQQQQKLQRSFMPEPPSIQPQSLGTTLNGGYKMGSGSGPHSGSGLHPTGQADGGGRLGTGALSPSSKPGQSVNYQGQRALGGDSDLGGLHTGVGAGRILNSQTSPYGRPVVSPAHQPAPVYSNRGPIARNQAPARIMPIAALNPYQGRWTIKARVTAKGDLRRYHNAKGDGKVFHFDLLDAEGGEIRVTCFNSVADQFYDPIEVGKVYMISKGSLKAAQRNFNHLKNDWEIFLESSSTVQRCIEEDDSIPQQQFNFIPISEIENMEGNTMVDVIGVVVAVSPTNTILRKNGTETQKRTLQLRDMSGRSVELTMWGTFCARDGQLLQDLCDSGQFPILAVKAGRISDFSGRSVGTISTTQLLVDPDLPKAREIKQWFQHEGKNTASHSISQEGGTGTRIEMRKTVAQIKDEGLGRSDKPDWIAVKGTISFIKTNTFCYTACPLLVGDRQCNKKVTNYGDGMWRCDRCDKSVPECDYRYLLSVQVQDHTGVTWITAFQEAGEEIMGVTAKELYLWKKDENPRFEDQIQKLLFSQHLFKLKVKEENYNDELHVKCTIVKTERLDYSAESRALLALIGKLSREESIDRPGLATSSFAGGNNLLYGSASLDYGVSAFAGGGQGGTQRVTGFGSPGNTYKGTPTALGGGYGAADSSNMYSAGGSCYKCMRAGHLARDCPTGMGGGPNSVSGGFNGGGSMSSTSSCFKCGQGGHWSRDCPNQGRGGGFGRETSSGRYGGNGSYARGF